MNKKLITIIFVLMVSFSLIFSQTLYRLTATGRLTTIDNYSVPSVTLTMNCFRVESPHITWTDTDVTDSYGNYVLQVRPNMEGSFTCTITSNDEKIVTPNSFTVSSEENEVISKTININYKKFQNIPVINLDNINAQVYSLDEILIAGNNITLSCDGQINENGTILNKVEGFSFSGNKEVSNAIDYCNVEAQSCSLPCLLSSDAGPKSGETYFFNVNYYIDASNRAVHSVILSTAFENNS